MLVKLGAMPFLYLVLYMLAETVAFWAVAEFLGLFWTLIVLFITMFFGMSIAGIEVRRLMSKQVEQASDGTYYVRDNNMGLTAGNVGLTLAGGMLLSLPGFLTSLLGILLIFAPTRSLFRKVMAVSIYRKVEKMGARIYEASPMAQQHDSYGNFGSFGQSSGQNESHEVIDEEELRHWSENLKPDDFGPHSGDENSQGGEK
ncbi:FxsA family protein [Corynebacterium macginleyi]|uniref:FxsA family protein n=2 Tax=Corynebacterium macginleyi TaxID=38290 RepID=A0A3M0G692_9CORY|nr:FxsA family protein [Corynebacterium macginleyi]MBK4143223.1 FxsA family protein [Corynebacterium macginleyi]MBK4146176.1 FxsA family protein [Corynebacterium macginleyi]MBK4157715.1 FxsA family protein [Corynebacterium macginleyi]MBK4164564.1 FxsA family protein [Corynebacterium macginleyi]